MPAAGRTCQRRDEEGYQYRQGTPNPEVLGNYIPVVQDGLEEKP